MPARGRSRRAAASRAGPRERAAARHQVSNALRAPIVPPRLLEVRREARRLLGAEPGGRAVVGMLDRELDDGAPLEKCIASPGVEWKANVLDRRELVLS